MLENSFMLDFSGNFKVYAYIQVSFMRVSKYLNQRVRSIANGKENLSRVFQKEKRKKTTHEEIEFHNSI